MERYSKDTVIHDVKDSFVFRDHTMAFGVIDAIVVLIAHATPEQDKTT